MSIHWKVGRLNMLCGLPLGVWLLVVIRGRPFELTLVLPSMKVSLG